jgi:hypothetical protein
VREGESGGAHLRCKAAHMMRGVIPQLPRMLQNPGHTIQQMSVHALEQRANALEDTFKGLRIRDVRLHEPRKARKYVGQESHKVGLQVTAERREHREQRGQRHGGLVSAGGRKQDVHDTLLVEDDEGEGLRNAADFPRGLDPVVSHIGLAPKVHGLVREGSVTVTRLVTRLRDCLVDVDIDLQRRGWEVSHRQQARDLQCTPSHCLF